MSCLSLPYLWFLQDVLNVVKTGCLGVDDRTQDKKIACDETFQSNYPCPGVIDCANQADRKTSLGLVASTTPPKPHAPQEVPHVTRDLVTLVTRGRGDWQEPGTTTTTERNTHKLRRLKGTYTKGGYI